MRRVILIASLSISFFSFVSGGSDECVKDYLKRRTVFYYDVISPGSPNYSSSLEIISVAARIPGHIIRAEISELDRYYVQFYARDTNCFYAFTHNWFKPEWDPMSTETYDFNGDSLAYSFHMKVGDSLDGGQGFKRGPKAPPTWGSYLTVSERKVTRLDTLSLPFGEVPAFLITAKSTRTEREGDRELSKTYATVREWFSPVYGIVQVETVDQNGKIITKVLREIKVRK